MSEILLGDGCPFRINADNIISVGTPEFTFDVDNGLTCSITIHVTTSEEPLVYGWVIDSIKPADIINDRFYQSCIKNYNDIMNALR